MYDAKKPYQESLHYNSDSIHIYDACRIRHWKMHNKRIDFSRVLSEMYGTSTFMKSSS